MKVPVGQVVVGAVLIVATIIIATLVSSADITSGTKRITYLALGLMLLTYSVVAIVLLRRKVREHRQRAIEGP